ncbi:DUF418 domain-containing protein [Viridibacillus arvi]|nr:DUF418 domain-containing protein [Viridibacillus sp. JNUCC-6]
MNNNMKKGTQITSIKAIYCIVFLIIQVCISTIIMKKHRYGPFEFIWRKLVFGGK